MNLSAFHYIIGVFLIILFSQLVIRLVRYYYKFPIPACMVELIDNPLRRRIQPPTEMPRRHGIKPGMTVLEVGPGNGTYTIETARRIGPSGFLITVDIQPDVIKRVKTRAKIENITVLDGLVADVHHLPFSSDVFNATYMIAVIGEIPNPQGAMHEFCRVLLPKGTLAFSEILVDPDYPLTKTLEKWAGQANFRLKEKMGNFFTYTLQFENEKILVNR